MSRRRKRKRNRRIVLTVLVLLFLAALGVGTVYVLKVAKRRTSPDQQALTAYREGDYAAAEREARRILEADPTHVRARSILVNSMRAEQRHDLPQVGLVFLGFGKGGRILQREKRGRHTRILAANLLTSLSNPKNIISNFS